MAERFRPAFFLSFILFPQSMVRRRNKLERCEKIPRILIGIFLLGLVSTAPMVSKSIKIERCSQHLVWFREPCGFYSNSDGKCIIMRIRGRRNNIPYVPFEALKARDLRLKPVPHPCISHPSSAIHG